MLAIARKVNVGLAAGAIVAAATLSPVSVAHATVDPFTSVGTHIGAPPCVPAPGVDCPVQLLQSAAQQSANFSFDWDSLIQNNLWWLGRENPNAPPRSPILVFTPMTLIPGFLKPLYGWFTANWDLEVCVLGLTATLGAYGKTTISVGRGCN